ncbi:hypothetical protein O181_078000 [Austropuccinia psidii MF-1]|uniref:CCHC-type domain-containing protein n=1 Tax=Austropuccinia psidii MF-1 TaxID=1389203 RepID=A0A9Q3IGI8_9BASI|nr:hypothetical protein [Austropuccinia psidii MF-1]
MKTQPQGHVMDNQYHQYETKPDAMLMNKASYPLQYQDGDNMSYSEKESLKQLPEALTWPKFSVTGEYNHMDLLDYIDGLVIDVPSIPDYWITARINTAFKGHASIWYTEMKEIHGGRVKSSKSTAMDKPRERVAEVAKRKNSCHNCGSTDHYANNCPKAKKKVYAIEKVPEEESPTEDSDSDSMRDAIRDQSDKRQDPREVFLVEYQEETPLEIQDIHGTHCSIVVRNYLDNHFPIWETQNFPTKAKTFKSTSGKINSIGTITQEIILTHSKVNIRLNTEFVVLDVAHIQGFLLGTDYQRMYGIDIYNSKNRHIIIGTNKEKKFSLDIYKISAQDPLEELLNEFREG